MLKSLVREPDRKLFVDWTPYLGHEWTADHDTSFPMKRLQELGQQINTLPKGFIMQRQVDKTYEDRRGGRGTLPCNWGPAETLAYATLLDQNIEFDLPVRTLVAEPFRIGRRPCTTRRPASPTRLQHIRQSSPASTCMIRLSEEAVLA